MDLTIQGYRISDYDFLDIGSHLGGSLTYAPARFGSRPGVGIDVYEPYVTEARAKNFPVIHGPVGIFDDQEKLFRYCTMIHFLEHMPDEATIKYHLQVAMRLARDFVFIRHPSFESMAYLKMLGLRQYWTNWSGHSSMLTIDDFIRLFDELGVHEYVIRPHELIVHSRHGSIVPYVSPVDKHSYEEDIQVYGPKPLVDLESPVWDFIDLFIPTRIMPPKEWSKVLGIKATVPAAG